MEEDKRLAAAAAGRAKLEEFRRRKAESAAGKGSNGHAPAAAHQPLAAPLQPTLQPPPAAPQPPPQAPPPVAPPQPVAPPLAVPPPPRASVEAPKSNGIVLRVPFAPPPPLAPPSTGFARELSPSPPPRASLPQQPASATATAATAFPEVLVPAPPASALSNAYASLSDYYYDDEVADVPSAPAAPARASGAAPSATPSVNQSWLHLPPPPPPVAPLLARPPPAVPPSPDAGSVLSWLQHPSAAPPPSTPRSQPIPLPSPQQAQAQQPPSPLVPRAPPRAHVALSPRASGAGSPRRSAPPSEAVQPRSSLMTGQLEDAINAITAEKLEIARQLERTQRLMADLSEEHAQLMDSYNGLASRLEAARADAAAYGEEATEAAAAVAAAAAERDAARSMAAAAHERAGALAAEAIGLEERLLQCRSRELRAVAAADNAVSAAAAAERRAGAAASEVRAARAEAAALRAEKGALLRRLRVMAREREASGAPPLSPRLFEEEEERWRAERPDTPPAPPSPEPPAPTPVRSPATPACGPSASATPANTPSGEGGAEGVPGVGLSREEPLSEEGAETLLRINALLGELEREQRGAQRSATAAELAASNLALSRQLAAAHARLRQLGEQPPAVPDDALASGEDSPRTPASAPRSSTWGNVFGGGARA